MLPPVDRARSFCRSVKAVQSVHHEQCTSSNHSNHLDCSLQPIAITAPSE